MASSGLKFVVFLGTVRENNLGSRAAKFVTGYLRKKGFAVTLLDPVELDLPLLKKPFHFYKDPSEIPKVLKDTNKVIADADAFVVITAEYNHCMPPGLTNLMDHFPIKSYKYRPSGIVSYSMGSFGGVRASMQARSLLGEIGSPSVSTIFAIPTIQKALSEEGEPLDERMESGVERLVKELEWYATALKKHREAEGLPQ